MSIGPDDFGNRMRRAFRGFEKGDDVLLRAWLVRSGTTNCLVQSPTHSLNVIPAQGGIYLNQKPWVPACERVKKSKVQALDRFQTVIPAKAGIQYSKWLAIRINALAPRLLGPRLRGDDTTPRQQERFMCFVDFFTRSCAETARR
jgi:hypothetical protein